LSENVRKPQEGFLTQTAYCVGLLYQTASRSETVLSHRREIDLSACSEVNTRHLRLTEHDKLNRFYARQHAAARICHGNSARPSVCHTRDL